MIFLALVTSNVIQAFQEVSTELNGMVFFGILLNLFLMAFVMMYTLEMNKLNKKQFLLTFNKNELISIFN
jgi:hypothetical protein